jgi:hypothetical protein
MKQLQENDISPFTKYRLGYIDGYTNNEIQMPEDKDYKAGYEEGKADDLCGNPSRFSDTGTG